jgi:hypothetical protein
MDRHFSGPPISSRLCILSRSPFTQDAHTKFFAQRGGTLQAATWVPCRVLGYDEDTNRYRIAFSDSGREKLVARCGLLADWLRGVRYGADLSASD